MNDLTPLQTFSGVGYKPIHVMMYLRSIEKVAKCIGEDEQDAEELCQLMFYHGLRGEASDPFGLEGIWIGLEWIGLERPLWIQN